MAGRIVAHVTTMYARARRKPVCGSLRLKDSSMRNLQRLLLWTLAILGVLKDVLLHGRYRAISVVLYALMGWLIIVASQPLARAMPKPGIVLLIAGGVVYTVGIAFFAMSKRVVHAHGVWHLFALGGSILHYLAVVRYVALA